MKKPVKKTKALCGDGFGKLDAMFSGSGSKPQTKKLKVKCPGCKKQFSVDVPTASGGIDFNASPGQIAGGGLCPWTDKKTKTKK